MAIKKKNTKTVFDKAGNGRFITKTIYQVPEGTGGGGSGPSSEEIVEIVTTAGFIKESELADYALKTEIPKVDGFATKADVDNLIKTVGAAIQIGNAEHEININTNNRVMINSTYEVATFEPYAGQEGRKLLVLPNNDCLTGKKVDGTGVPLVFMSK